MKSLVVYYSRTGNTKWVAQEIIKLLSADEEEIIEKKDRSGAIGYFFAGKDAIQNRISDIHEIKKNPAAYDLIIIGTPVWAYNVTPAIRTYLSHFNLEGKKVILFATQDSMGAEKVFNAIRRLIPKADIVGEKYFNKVLDNQDKVKGEIAAWLEKIGVTK